MTVLVTFKEVQVYEFTDSETNLTYHWNATQGRVLAVARNANPYMVNLAEAGINLKTILDFVPDLDTERAKALPAKNLAAPLLFVPYGQRHVCIDGWDRVYKALYEGLQTLPAFLLTEQEANAILLGGGHAADHPG